ncbi:hypothetical protein B0J12DRAFT_697539 [Macrophomina phaseolina]|uniref:Uncharacterized protein n=1 Tax=Macrophomina phaseolina TaxID=35725 RepID=A0ABQ8GGZ1_9PEZI|nr:hypothetical protein B0J12DRAFT_697539 [Macrophomina phaseolina]
MAASQPDFGKEARRAQEMIAAGIEDDDVVVATVTGDVRGTRYPHILNHSSTYTIPSIEEVLDLCQEFPSPSNPASDPEPIYPNNWKSASQQQSQGQPEQGTRDRIEASVTKAYGGEVIGPGAQLYNLRYAFPSDCSPYAPLNGSVTKSDSDQLIIYRDDFSGYSSSASGDEDAVHLTTIHEEPEPPELEADIDVVKTAFKTRRQKEVVSVRGRGVSGEEASCEVTWI